MAAEGEQDRWLERVLRRRGAEAPATAASGACLDSETLAAWADGALSAKELAAAEIHASSCSRCIALLADIERTAPAVSVESHSRGALFRWLVPLAAAATAIAIWVAIPSQRVTPVAREDAPASVFSTPPTPKQPAAPPPLEPPESMVEQKQAPSARVDNFADMARRTPPEARKERDAAESISVTGQRPRAAPEPPPAPAPSASADASSEKLAAAAERRALNETVTVVIGGISATDPLIRWRSLAGVEIERSIDGGQNWTKTAVNPPGRVAAIQVVDALNATVTTPDGRRFSTSDGGATWAPVQEKPAAPF